MNTSWKLAAALVAVAGMIGFGTVAADEKPGQGQGRKPGDRPRVGGDAKAPAERLVGTYQIASGRVGDKDLPAERLKDAVVTITRDKMVGVAKDKSQIFVASYTVKTDGAAAAADKNQVTVVMKGEKPGEGEATGLVQVQENGDLRLVYNLPGGPAPTGFEPKDRQQMFVLKRLEAGDKGDKDGTTPDRGTDRPKRNKDSQSKPKRDPSNPNPSDK